MIKSYLKLSLTMIAVLFTGPFSALYGEEFREVVDESGHRVKVPELINKIYGVSPPVTNFLLTIAPEKLVGLNSPLTEEQQIYLPESIGRLSVVGGRFGQGRNLNLESLLAAEPQVVINWRGSSSQKQIEKTFARFSVPVFDITMDNLTDYPKTWLALGELLGLQERAGVLSEKALFLLGKAGEIAAKFKDADVRVYYAEGQDGLQTKCPESSHMQAFIFMGAKPVHHCENNAYEGKEIISKEKLLIYNPDVIIVQQEEFWRELISSEIWQGLSAVQKKRFFLVPDKPFNWLDRPPSFMRLIGILWLGHVLYGEPVLTDFQREMLEFYRLFLGAEEEKIPVQELLKHAVPEK
jgi:iron complex transport system substrate-binding protein